jgi:hypothetical protein
MQKKLIAVGNSFALVIDKGTMRRLGIKGDSLLHAEIEGCRLMVERSGNDAASPEQIDRMKKATTIRALTMLLQELDANGMRNCDLERLSYDGVRALEIHGLASLGVIDPITLVRLRKCQARRKLFDESWETTIETVLANTPSTRQSLRRGRTARAWRQVRCPLRKRSRGSRDRRRPA